MSGVEKLNITNETTPLVNTSPSTISQPGQNTQQFLSGVPMVNPGVYTAPASNVGTVNPGPYTPTASNIQSTMGQASIPSGLSQPPMSQTQSVVSNMAAYSSSEYIFYIFTLTYKILMSQCLYQNASKL